MQLITTLLRACYRPKVVCLIIVLLVLRIYYERTVNRQCLLYVQKEQEVAGPKTLRFPAGQYTATQTSHTSSVNQHTTKGAPENSKRTTDFKIIYGATDVPHEENWEQFLNLENCEYQNCIMKNFTSNETEKADVVMFHASRPNPDFPILSLKTRQSQLWFITGIESSAYSHNLFPAWYNNQFNGTLLWRRDSSIYYPWGKAIHKVTNQPYYLMQNKSIPKVHYLDQIDFAAGKNKGAFAYLTNCGSLHFDRKALMLEINKYTPVDIYSAECKGDDIKKSPCPRLPAGANPKCEEEFNHHHHFFLAFENSLCKDYVTEKFWDRLKSPVYFLPVAMGGLSMEEYTSIAPPDSFLHVDNFTSVKALGEYMKYLTENDEAYNRYHQWRYDYRITTSRGFAGCQICKLANVKPAMPVIPHIDQWFNDPGRCRTYNIT